jgi:hypothetical protein
LLLNQLKISTLSIKVVFIISVEVEARKQCELQGGVEGRKGEDGMKGKMESLLCSRRAVHGFSNPQASKVNVIILVL